MQKLKNIYKHLQDSVSQEIFCNRLLYNITSDMDYLEKMVNIMMKHSSKTTKLYPLLCKIRASGGVIIYGAGAVGEALGNYLERLDISISAFCDSNPVKQKHMIQLSKGEKQIISLDDLALFHANEFVMVASNNPFYRKQIIGDLLQKGLGEEQIIEASDFFGKQYFDASVPFPQKRIEKDKIFVDAGCYDLGTALEYKEWNKGGKVISFEPDYSCYKKCIELYEFLEEEEISIYQKGLWCKKGHLKFDIKKDGTTRVTDREEGIKLDVVTIDEMMQGKKCGFIKMDIEGSEYEALQGAKKTIIKDHPILAISIYHKSEDIIQIPEYILELSGIYRFYIRHYSTNLSETVLYAI